MTAEVAVCVVGVLAAGGLLAVSTVRVALLWLAAVCALQSPWSVVASLLGPLSLSFSRRRRHEPCRAHSHWPASATAHCVTVPLPLRDVWLASFVRRH